MQTHKAFTLIEMLIVLSIITLFFSFAFSEIKNYWALTQAILLQTQLIQSIQMAQEEAHLRHAPIALCGSADQINCSGEWHAGQLVFVNERKNGEVRDLKQILASFHHAVTYGTLHWRAFPYYRNYLLFFPNRQTNVDNGLFWLCHEHDENPIWALALAKSGRVRILLPDKNGVFRDARGNALSCNDLQKSDQHL